MLEMKSGTCTRVIKPRGGFDKCNESARDTTAVAAGRRAEIVCRLSATARNYVPSQKLEKTRLIKCVITSKLVQLMSPMPGCCLYFPRPPKEIAKVPGARTLNELASNE